MGDTRSLDYSSCKSNESCSLESSSIQPQSPSHLAGAVKLLEVMSAAVGVVAAVVVVMAAAAAVTEAAAEVGTSMTVMADINHERVITKYCKLSSAWHLSVAPDRICTISAEHV